MKKLIKYLAQGITGIEKVEVEKTDEINYLIKVPKDSVGLVIGKRGNTIKTIRNLVKVKATLDNTRVNINVEEIQ